MMLWAEGIRACLGGVAILQGVDLALPEGELRMIVGPNGSGKTTLVRALVGAIPRQGSALLDGRDIASMPAKERARRIAVLTQQSAPPFAYTARDLVAVGRYAYRQGVLGSLSEEDQRAMDLAFRQTRTQHLAGRQLATLSGGELQRVRLAQVLAQQPDVLLLDEPTNHLDIQHQILLFDILKDWLQTPGRAAMAIVHDLNLAQMYADWVGLLSGGIIVAQGPPMEVFSGDVLREVYQADLAGWMRSALRRWEGDDHA